MGAFTKKDSGFTLYELMVVIAIIGALAAIALPNFMKYRGRSYDSKALYDARNAYSAAQLYFSDHYEEELVGLSDIEYYGFRQSDNVDVAADGGVDDLTITTKHNSSKNLFSVNSAGTITQYQ